MKKIVYPLVLWSLLAGAASAQEAERLAQRLVERSGLAVQLEALPKAFAEQMGQLRGQAPDELLLAIGDAARDAYEPKQMAQGIAQTLAQILKPQEMRSALAWLETGVGRRVTLAEERAAASMDEAALKRYAEQTKNEKPRARRRQLIQDLVEATGSLEFGARMMEGMALGVAIGMDSVQPVQKRAGAARIRKQIEKAMPKEQLKADLRATMPGFFAYTYREVSDADLEAYLVYLRSADGKRCNDAIGEALTEAMVAASVRLGQAVERRAPKQPA
jgi:hypothetical protein